MLVTVNVAKLGCWFYSNYAGLGQSVNYRLTQSSVVDPNRCLCLLGVVPSLVVSSFLHSFVRRPSVTRPSCPRRPCRLTGRSRPQPSVRPSVRPSAVIRMSGCTAGRSPSLVLVPRRLASNSVSSSSGQRFDVQFACFPARSHYIRVRLGGQWPLVDT